MITFRETGRTGGGGEASPAGGGASAVGVDWACVNHFKAARRKLRRGDEGGGSVSDGVCDSAGSEVSPAVGGPASVTGGRWGEGTACSPSPLPGGTSTR